MFNTNLICKRNLRNLNQKKLNFFEKNLSNIAKKNLLKNDFMTKKSYSWNWISSKNLKIENLKSDWENKKKMLFLQKKKTIRQKLSFD